VEARYEPDVLVLDGITVSARARGHRVSVSTGADAPRRVDRVMSLLSRLHEKYLDAADGSAAARARPAPHRPAFHAEHLVA
jgi:hypothetical protein